MTGRGRRPTSLIMGSVSIQEAKAEFSKLLERAHAGEEILISKRGKPFARLCPLEPAQARRPGLLKGELGSRFFEPLPDEELDASER